MTRLSLDLNADVGEGSLEDAGLFDAISSANVACGGHAGDDESMRVTVQLARARGVAVGAHPSFDDREQFGRREMLLSSQQLHALVLGQITRLARIAADQGVAVRHVKPHGALYNVSARDADVAAAIAAAVVACDRSLVLVGLSGSQSIAAARRAGLRAASEVFADRGYDADGSLVPRGRPGAVLHDPEVVIARAIAMARDGSVMSIDGRRITIEVDTICVHSDTPGAAQLARQLRAALEAAGIDVAAIGSSSEPRRHEGTKF
jgi:5-oxoprolinase (ATP-hydrolysing) subunit A